MTAELHNFSLFGLFLDVLVGLIGLTAILIFHGLSINSILVRFDLYADKALLLKRYDNVFFWFYLSLILIALIHVAEIFFWALGLVAMGLVSSLINGLLFSGSCYTTVGFVDDLLPTGWKSLAFFISFSGVFSLAWTTSVMIHMTTLHKAAWRAKHRHIKHEQAAPSADTAQHLSQRAINAAVRRVHQRNP
jgi:hypothetical protein